MVPRWGHSCRIDHSTSCHNQAPIYFGEIMPDLVHLGGFFRFQIIGISQEKGKQ